MANRPMDAEITLQYEEKKHDKNCAAENRFIDTNDSSNSVTNLKLALERKTAENLQLHEQLSRAQLSAEQLRIMIATTSMQIRQINIEFEQTEKEYKAMLDDEHQRMEYETREMNALKSELKELKALLAKRTKRLEEANSRNLRLHDEITNYRCKIYRLHVNEVEAEAEQDNISYSGTTRSSRNGTTGTTTGTTTSSSASTTAKSTTASDTGSLKTVILSSLEESE